MFSLLRSSEVDGAVGGLQKEPISDLGNFGNSRFSQNERKISIWDFSMFSSILVRSFLIKNLLMNPGFVVVL